MKKEDLISLAKGAGIAAAGAVLTYVSAWASNTDFGSMTPAVVAVFSVAANALRKYLNPTTEGAK